jgi:hypothetical protein
LFRHLNYVESSAGKLALFHLVHPVYLLVINIFVFHGNFPASPLPAAISTAPVYRESQLSARVIGSC